MSSLGSVGRWVTSLFLCAGCHACAGGNGGGDTPADETPEARAATAASGGSNVEGAAAAPGDTGEIPYYADGAVVRRVDGATAEREGLTILDLGDDWVPGNFREDPSLGRAGTQPYRAELIRLANEESEDARGDVSRGYLELYGISPSIDIVRRRLVDDARHRCHDAIDDAPIETLSRALRPGSDIPRQRNRANASRYLRTRLEEQATRRRLGSIEELATDRRWGRELRRLHELDEELATVRAVQAHLRCEGSLSSRSIEGVLDGHAGAALRAWQSKNMIISLASQLDEATRRSLAMDSREIDFLSLLRTLRERVADAGGLIEDGTASNDWGLVVDRQLNIDDEFRAAERMPALENGAPDRISPATDAAARALGWTDAASAGAWLTANHAARTPTHLVAVRLPPPPAYYSDNMDLRVEIDRGDVHYGVPYTPEGRPRGFTQRRRPMTTIFVRHDGTETALVRWHTTIGSWQPEINPEGGVGLRYKESDVGPRVWRDLVSGPAWLPPPSTPDDELLRPRSGGGWRVHTSITGPGYDSAYGLAMVIHHLVRGEGAREEDFVDRGIRSHGSVSYRSILRGYSHGCHRLFNHLAVRMSSFLLAHRPHVVRGRIPAQLRRELRPEGSEETLTLEIDTRGFLFQLTPPVPVEVLPGHIIGPARPSLAFHPLPEQMQEAARAAAEADPSGAGAGGEVVPTGAVAPAAGAPGAGAPIGAGAVVSPRG